MGRGIWRLLVAVVLMVGGVGCDVVHRNGGDVPRHDVKASNPPKGLPAEFTRGQRLRWRACADAGEGYECAVMKAPLDHRKPEQDAIDVALIRKRATGPERDRIGSLVLNFGGPGVSGVDGLPKYAGQYASLGERYDLVSFDPRGVGRTIPVTCGEKAYEGSGECAKRSGKVLPFVGTSRTARDLDLLRYLLGDEKLHYFGVSYGTQLGGVYAHLFPRHVGRTVLEAPVDPTVDRVEGDIEQVKAVQRAYERFSRWCVREYRHCPVAREPDPRAVEGLRKKFRDQGDAAHAISNFLDSGTAGWKPLAGALTDAVERGDGTRLMRKAYDREPGARAESASASADNGTSALVAITCADSDLRPGYERAAALERRLADASTVFGKAWGDSVYLCYDWPYDGEAATPDVRAAGAAPVLVVANTGDPTTPYVGGRRMARELGAGVGVLLGVRAEGHGSYPQEECAARAIDGYLLAGRVPRDGTRCG
ncbi:alpha/beta hydrolase [Streptomyces sp. SDT5-1]|uniref:alpha/beta hydrolase n=1 Tax=Streptomyces sp. SDT5-1 TaxID=3406418 RepID=UPI003FD37AF1